MLKPTQPRKCCGCAPSSRRISDSYSSIPLPSITVCSGALTAAHTQRHSVHMSRPGNTRSKYVDDAVSNVRPQQQNECAHKTGLSMQGLMCPVFNSDPSA